MCIFLPIEVVPSFIDGLRTKELNNRAIPTQTIWNNTVLEPGILYLTYKPLVHYLKWSSFVFSVQIYSRMHADLSLA